VHFKNFDFVFDCLRDFADELALQEEELDAKPNVRDVVFARHHQVKAVKLVGLGLLLAQLQVDDLRRLLIPVKQLLRELDCLLSESSSVELFLADLVCTGHRPLRDLSLDHKLDVKLVVDFEAAVDGLSIVLDPAVA